jgi:hypothetical protein
MFEDVLGPELKWMAKRTYMDITQPDSDLWRETIYSFIEEFGRRRTMNHPIAGYFLNKMREDGTLDVDRLNDSQIEFLSDNPDEIINNSRPSLVKMPIEERGNSDLTQEQRERLGKYAKIGLEMLSAYGRDAYIKDPRMEQIIDLSMRVGVIEAFEPGKMLAEYKGKQANRKGREWEDLN